MHWWHWLNHFQFTEYLLPVLVGAISPYVRDLWQHSRESRATSWPSGDAVVQSAHVKQPKGELVEVSYRYYALAEDRYGKYHRHFRRKADAENFAGAVRGVSLPVRYQPDKPGVSVMIERDLQMAGLVAGSLGMR